MAEWKSVLDPVSWEETIPAKKTADEAARTIAAYARRSASEVTVDDDRVSVRSGSRLAYRMLGVRAGAERLPLRWTATTKPDEDGSQVQLKFESDSGRYLFRIDAAVDAYRERFADVIGEVEAALSAGMTGSRPI